METHQWEHQHSQGREEDLGVCRCSTREYEDGEELSDLGTHRPSPTAVEEKHQVHKPDDLLFTNQKLGQPFSQRTWHDSFCEMLVEARLAEWAEDDSNDQRKINIHSGKTLTWYSFRHSYITMRLKAGTPVAVVAANTDTSLEVHRGSLFPLQSRWSNWTTWQGKNDAWIHLRTELVGQLTHRPPVVGEGVSQAPWLRIVWCLCGFGTDQTVVSKHSIQSDASLHHLQTREFAGARAFRSWSGSTGERHPTLPGELRRFALRGGWRVRGGAFGQW